MEEQIHLGIHPYPELINSSYRYFNEGEKHVTRTCDYHVLLFMLEGSLFFTENGKKVSLNPGDWYIQKAGLFQEGLRPCSCPKYYYIHFNAQILHESSLTLSNQGNFNPTNLLPLFDELEYYQNRLLWDTLGKQALFLNILNELIQYRHEESLKAYPFVEDMVSYIHDNYMNPISLDDMADNYHFSKDYIIRRMKKIIGFTPIQYLTHVRIKHAKILLENSNQTIDEIAESVGYKDLSVFYKAFTKKESLSPGKWRKTRRNHI